MRIVVALIRHDHGAIGRVDPEDCEHRDFGQRARAACRWIAELEAGPVQDEGPISGDLREVSHLQRVGLADDMQLEIGGQSQRRVGADDDIAGDFHDALHARRRIVAPVIEIGVEGDAPVNDGGADQVLLERD